MRVVFLGNHTVGVKALKALLERVDVVGVVAHPEDSEDGVRYQSVYQFAQDHNLPVLRGRGKDPAVKEFVQQAAPDLLWVTDFRYLLPEALLNVTNRGAVNLHPSLLPRYRGRASINWAILNGEDQIGLTAHFVDAGADTGDIIKQRAIYLSKEEDVGDALKRLMPLYDELTREVIGLFQEGKVQGTPQDHTKATEYPARSPEDGLIDWNQPAHKVRDLVRAVAAPYPGAFAFFPGGRLYVWKARDEGLPKNTTQGERPGTILSAAKSGELVIQCGVGALRLRNWELQPSDGISLVSGTVLPNPSELS